LVVWLGRSGARVRVRVLRRVVVVLLVELCRGGGRIGAFGEFGEGGGKFWLELRWMNLMVFWATEKLTWSGSFELSIGQSELYLGGLSLTDSQLVILNLS
jgi:hypothetical protein